MKERVVIWGDESEGFHWFCSVIPQGLEWQTELASKVQERGYSVAYAGELTPELDAKYPEYAGI